jgi:hypothetical protein
MSREQAAKKFEVVQRSVYIGRCRLGRVAQTEKKRFQAFDAEDRRLGVFTSGAKALAAIRAAGTGARGAEERAP